MPGYAFALSSALAVATAAAAVPTFLITDVLRGTDVMNGSARGTALVALLIAVPVVSAAMWRAATGSARAVFVWFGTTLYLAYNAFMFLFATPFNRLFLLYVVTMALTIASTVAMAVGADVAALRDRCAATLPARGLAIYVWVVVGLNLLVWLARVVPAVGSSDAPEFLDGTGLTTNPVFVQDLAFWLPLLAVAAAWLWRRLPWGYLLVAGGLTMWVLEAITIATDQWFGHDADPASKVASVGAVPGFIAAAAIGLVALVSFLRHVDSDERNRMRTTG